MQCDPDETNNADEEGIDADNELQDNDDHDQQDDDEGDLISDAES